MVVSLASWLQEMVRLERTNASTLARALGVQQPTVSRWLKGGEVPSPNNCHRLAGYYGVSADAVMALAGLTPAKEGQLDALMEGSRYSVMQRLLQAFGDTGNTQGRVLPIWGAVPAGTAELVEETVQETYSIPPGVIVSVNGDCLEELGIHDGDRLLIDISGLEQPNGPQPKRGQVVVVRLLQDNAITLKRWVPLNDHVRLEPANEKYQAILATDVQVLGIAREIIRSL